MSDTFFSKLDSFEKNHRLGQLATAKGKFTVWEKGSSDKHTLYTTKFVKDRLELHIDAFSAVYPHGTPVLLNFNLRGMTFFAKGVAEKTANGTCFFKIEEELYKSERRSSYRLLAFPQHTITAEFDLGPASAKAKVFDLKSKKASSQTGLFKNFLNLISEHDHPVGNTLKIKLQDLSTSGLAIHISEIESEYFGKDKIFKNVKLTFTDEVIEIPEMLVVYVVHAIGGATSARQYKVGIHFSNLPAKLDDQLSRKISHLLRATDFDRDFENFVK